MANLACRPGWRGTGNNNNAVNFYQVNLGKKTHAGKILGGGTSGDEVLSSTASEKMASFYTKNSATSGTSVALYWKHEVSGIAGSGVVGRFYGYTNVAAALLVGAQITAETGAAGKVSGLMVGCRSQVSFADDATAAPTGTIAGGQSELYFNGDDSSTTDVSAATVCSIHRFVIDGDTTARAKVPYVFEFVGLGSAGSSEELLSTKYATASHGLRCLIDNVKYRILLDAE
ncbi:MAG: hypothetical protein M0R00_01395 [Candidatus Omnitrophica bacterium]|jgi:hypothetical protein|nr:hypothetical protein [Candidatus Omnitrophota bacterium]